jgi:hypothetical protein
MLILIYKIYKDLCWVQILFLLKFLYRTKYVRGVFAGKIGHYFIKFLFLH